MLFYNWIYKLNITLSKIKLVNQRAKTNIVEKQLSITTIWWGTMKILALWGTACKNLRAGTKNFERHLDSGIKEININHCKCHNGLNPFLNWESFTHGCHHIFYKQT